MKSRKIREKIVVILARVIIFTLAFSIFSSFSIFSAFSVSCFAKDEKKEKTGEEKFQEAMKYVGSLKNPIQTDGNVIYAGTLKFEPEKAFSDPKTQKSWYTKDPEPVRYYSDTTEGNVYEMQKEASAETRKDANSQDLNGNPVPTPAKTVTKNFRSRPVFKVTSNDEYISKGKLVTQNARNIVTGESNKDITCQENKDESKVSKISKDKETCVTTYVKKVCTEEVRVCEKVPEIRIKEEIYPNCQVRISPSGKEECFIDKYAPGGFDYNGCNGCPDTCNPYQVKLPKHLHGRVEVAGSNHGYFYVTVINKTTGQTMYDHSKMNNGEAFELTHSHAQDQVFKFDVCRADRCSCDKPGFLTLYIDRKYRSANIDWKESCNEQ